jgi:hypothetical protein
VESYDLTITHRDQTGAPADDYWTMAIGLEQWITEMPFSDDGSGAATVRLPAGRYGLTSMIVRPIGEAEEPEQFEVAFLARPNVKLAADTTVAFDARRSAPVRVTVPEPTAVPVLVDVTVGFHVKDAGVHSVGVVTESFEGLTTGQLGAPARKGEFSSYIASQWLQVDESGGITGSPYFYGLTDQFVGQVPTGFTRHYRPRDLATVRHRFRGVSHGDRTDRLVFPSYTEYDLGGTAIIAPIELPSVRVEHYSVSSNLEWLTGLEFSNTVEGEVWPELTAVLVSLPQSYQPGKRTVDTWNVAPFGPTFGTWDRSGGAVRRIDNTIIAEVSLFSDAHGHVGSVRPETARTALYRNGKLVDEFEEPGFGWFEVPRAQANYRLETSLTHQVSDFSTSVSAVWTFPSGPVARKQTAALPVMAVHFAPNVDATNTAAAGRLVDIPFTVAHQPGVTGIGVRKPTIEASFDGGATWQPAEVRSAKAGWTAQVRHPKQDGFVSLRASVTDNAGNTVQQTIIQAYRIAVR